MKRVLSIILAVALVVCAIPAMAFAAEDHNVMLTTTAQKRYSDVTSPEWDWASEAIYYWSDQGVVQGDGGKFNPSGLFTRAQASLLMANFLTLTEKKDISQYKDLKSTDWFYEGFEKTVAAGIFQGSTSTTMEPNATVTREMYFVIAAKAMNIPTATKLTTSYPDESLVSDWARPYVYGLIEAGYVTGIDGYICPQKEIDRASAVVLLRRMIKSYEIKDGKAVIVLVGQTPQEQETTGPAVNPGTESGSYHPVYPIYPVVITHRYEILADGAWKCTKHGTIENPEILEGTTVPYICQVVNGQPKNVTLLATDTDINATVFKGIVTISPDGKTITYDRSSATDAWKVVIRTNGGKLIVDAKNDEVAHYGFASELDIKSVKTSSYTENGTIQFAEIAGGNFVLAAGAEVSNIHFDVNTETQKFENSDGLKISVDLTKATMTPDFSRDSVDIDPTNGTLVAQVKTTADDYIWLTKSGIIEVVTLSNSGTEATTNYATETDANYNIADQIANKVGRTFEGKVADKDITVGGKDYTIHFDEEVKEFKTYNKGTTTEATLTQDEKSTVEAAIKNDVILGGPSKEEILASATMFAGGKGTEDHPYLVANKEQFLKIKSSDSGMVYYKLQSDISLEEEFSYVAAEEESYYIDSLENVCIDGGHHIISTRHYSYFDGKDPFIFGILSGHVILKDLTVCNGMAIVYEVYPEADSDLVEFINVDTIGTTSGSDNNNSARYVAYLGSTKTRNINFINCDTYSNVIGSGFVGGYIGEFHFGRGSVTNLSFVDCNNYGNLISTGRSASMFVSNPTSYGNALNITVQNCSNEGNITYSGNNSGTFCFAFGGDYPVENTTINGVNVTEGIKTAEDIVKYLNDISNVTGVMPFKSTVGELTANNNKFVLSTVSDASRYELIFSFTGANGANAGYKFMFNEELPADIEVSEWLSYSETNGDLQEHNQYNCTYYTYDGRYVYNEPKARIGSNVTATFIAYDAEDNLVGIYTYIYSD